MNLQIFPNFLLKSGPLGGYSVIELENHEILVDNLTKSQAEEYVLKKRIERATPDHFEMMLSTCFNGLTPDIKTYGDCIEISSDDGMSIPGEPLKRCFSYLEMRGYTLWNIETNHHTVIRFKKKEEERNE